MHSQFSSIYLWIYQLVAFLSSPPAQFLAFLLFFYQSVRLDFFLLLSMLRATCVVMLDV